MIVRRRIPKSSRLFMKKFEEMLSYPYCDGKYLGLSRKYRNFSLRSIFALLLT